MLADVCFMVKTSHKAGPQTVSYIKTMAFIPCFLQRCSSPARTSEPFESTTWLIFSGHGKGEAQAYVHAAGQGNFKRTRAFQRLQVRVHVGSYLVERAAKLAG